MTVKENLAQLKEWESPKTKALMSKHGVKEPFHAVRIEDLKKIARKLKVNYELSLELFDTGNSDAMFLAGLISDGKKMTKEDLEHWADGAYWQYISENTVAWAAAESNYGTELALKWIDSDREFVADAGWTTLANLASMKADKELDLKLYKSLIERVVKTINRSPNRVRYSMNGFIISAGGFITSLTSEALTAAMKIGKIHVDLGGAACKVPVVKEQIASMEKKGILGKKRKNIKSA